MCIRDRSSAFAVRTLDLVDFVRIIFGPQLFGYYAVAVAVFTVVVAATFPSIAFTMGALYFIDTVVRISLVFFFRNYARTTTEATIALSDTGVSPTIAVGTIGLIKFTFVEGFGILTANQTITMAESAKITY